MISMMPLICFEKAVGKWLLEKNRCANLSFLHRNETNPRYRRSYLL